MRNIRIETDVVATTVSGHDLKVDIFKPGENANGLGILFMPGGGFRIANKAGLHERYAERMAEKGYVFIATEYRVMDEAPWPAQIQDTKAFIRWMRANSRDLAIDPDRIVLGGASAGGNLSLLAAVTPGNAEFEGHGGNEEVSSRGAAVIGVYPVSDVTNRGTDESGEKLYGKNPTYDLLKAASPVYQVNSAYPPTLLVHGTADTTVDHSNSMRMFEALEAAGVPVDIHLYAGQEHIFDREPAFAEAVSNAMGLFIERYVAAN